MYKNKFNVGDHVVLFNSASGEVEHDSVYGVLFVPKAVDGKQPDDSKTIAEQIEAGVMEVCEEYHTLQHQIMPAGLLFGSEEECRAYYRKLFAI